jgi:hypothetical protein
MDRQCGLKLMALKQAGVADDTIIIYYGDNGGITPRSKRFLHASGTHVPLILYVPPKWRHLAPAAPGARVGSPVHFVDFAATVLALAGVARPPTCQGVPFAGKAAAEAPRRMAFCSRTAWMSVRHGASATVSWRWLYIRNFRPEHPYVEPLSYMFRVRGYQSVARPGRRGAVSQRRPRRSSGAASRRRAVRSGERSPNNVVNLAGCAEQPAVMDRDAGARCGTTCSQTFDNGLLPEGARSMALRVAPRQARGRWRRPDTALLASAQTRITAGARAAARDLPAMPVRWWAALGLGLSSAARRSPPRPSLTALCADASGYVRVAAADALARQGRCDLALPVLQRAMDELSAPWCSLQACNALDRLGEAARPLLPAIRAFSGRVAEDEAFSSPQAYPRRILGHLLTCWRAVQNVGGTGRGWESGMRR